MEEKGKKNEESRPLNIDSKFAQSSLGALPQHITDDDARLEFYSIYEEETSRYDAKYAKKCNEDFNIVLIFAGLISAVSSAFIIDMHSKIEHDPNEDSVALLRAILSTLDQTAIPGEDSSGSPDEGPFPRAIYMAIALAYGSLAQSLMAALMTILDKREFEWYLLSVGRSTIERCGERQRRYDKLQVTSEPSTAALSFLLWSLLSLAGGISARLMNVMGYFAAPLVGYHLACGFLFYFSTIANTRSSEPPSRTPRLDLLKMAISFAVAPLLTIVAAGGSFCKRLSRSLAFAALHRMWDVMLRQILHVLLRLPPVGVGRRSRHSSLPTVQSTPQEPASWLAPLHSLWKNIQYKIFRMAPYPPQSLSSSTTQDISPNSAVTSPWLMTPTALAALVEANASDGKCASWILRNITDREALDAAIRLAGTIRWFKGGLDVEPPYDIIVSILEECVGSTRKLHPGLRERAYYAWRALLWIHVRAMCVSEEYALKFSLPTIPCDTTSIDGDLEDLLEIHRGLDTPGTLAWVYTTSPHVTPAHQRWTWNALLHVSWAKRKALGTFDSLVKYVQTRSVRSRLP